MSSTTTPAVTPRRDGEPEVDLTAYRLVHRAMLADTRAWPTSPTGSPAARWPSPRPGRPRSGRTSRSSARRSTPTTTAEDRTWSGRSIAASAGAAVDLAELTDDHGVIDPMLGRARSAATALGTAPDDLDAACRLASAMTEMFALLDEHIGEEEREVFPVIRRFVSVVDYEATEDRIRRDIALLAPALGGAVARATHATPSETSIGARARPASRSGCCSRSAGRGSADARAARRLTARPPRPRGCVSHIGSCWPRHAANPSDVATGQRGRGGGSARTPQRAGPARPRRLGHPLRPAEPLGHRQRRRSSAAGRRRAGRGARPASPGWRPAARGRTRLPRRRPASRLNGSRRRRAWRHERVVAEQHRRLGPQDGEELPELVRPLRGQPVPEHPGLLDLAGGEQGPDQRRLARPPGSSRRPAGSASTISASRPWACRTVNGQAQRIPCCGAPVASNASSTSPYADSAAS